MAMKTLLKHTKNLKLLYIEDEKCVRDESLALLENFFKYITVCKDGQEGLDIYKASIYQQNFVYDIVLTDILMPSLSGIDLIKEILKLNPKQHICVISAQDESSNLVKLINLGVNNFLLKPLKETHFIQTFSRISKQIKHEQQALRYENSIINANLFLEQEIQKRTQQLKDQLLIDQLTGLQNRMALKTQMEKNSYTMLALIDINRLLFINDLYGTNIGNQVIQGFANLLKKMADEENYMIYRTSGDEFVICSSDETKTRFKHFIQKLSKKVVNLPLYIQDIEDEIYIDATIGVSYELSHLASLGVFYNSNLLLTQADIALKNAKENKKQLVTYDETMNTLQKMQNIMEWKQKIKNAYEYNNIVAVYQPIVNANGEIIKYETLMRLREDTKLISPYFFLETAILTNEYPKLSRAIIEQALKKLIDTNHTISINLTYSDFKDPYLFKLLIQTLKNHDIGNRLIFEIVESEDIKDYKLFEKFVKKFKKYGVRIAIDDFGSGFSNFENIIKTAPEYIKIDGSLVKDIDKNKNALTIVKAIVQIAHELDIKVIAEFVHSKDVLEILKTLKVDEYQGFYFYEPALTFVQQESTV